MRLALALVALLICCLPSVADAQQCRLTCRLDETRDANGCCVPMAVAPRPASPRCPAGLTWSERDRACLGHAACRAGQHLDGAVCVIDAVSCRPGAHMDSGRCVADATSCPEHFRLEGERCIGEPTCPANTRLDAGQCISSDVTCPPGTTARPAEQGGGCVGQPVCPESTHFAEGRGCVGDVVCPPGTTMQAGLCVAPTICAPGQNYVGGRCVEACADVPHSHLADDRATCMCNTGYIPLNGRCERQTGCPDGSHADARGRCVGNVVCPAGYELVTGRGCIHAALRAQIEREAAEARERVAYARAVHWVEGPAVQFWAGGGYTYVRANRGYQIPEARNPARPALAALWQGPSFAGGASFSSQGLVLGASFLYVPGDVMTTSERLEPTDTGPTASRRYRSNPMLATLGEFGVQGVGERFTWRLLAQGGYDLGGSGLVGGGAFRAMIRIVSGLYAGAEGRFVTTFAGVGRNTDLDASSGPAGELTPDALAVEHGAGWGFGFGGYAFVGYSLH